MLLLIYLLVGAIAGLLAGLFGIGGGVIVVPALVFAFTLQGIDPNLVMHMAVATSLANIVFTALTAIYTHQKKQAIAARDARKVGRTNQRGARTGALANVRIQAQPVGRNCARRRDLPQHHELSRRKGDLRPEGGAL